ncbi:MAG: EamA family transporter [Betaproteobacteria bacterium]|nr:EamA family transporter [Betaproteobacteria bacterium]
MAGASFGLILVAILLGTCAQLLLKAGANVIGPVALDSDAIFAATLRFALEPRILAGTGCYAVSLVVWILGLTRMEVSVAYPMLSIGFALNAALAWWLLGEAVTPMRMLGIGVIIVGVALVARS